MFLTHFATHRKLLFVAALAVLSGCASNSRVRAQQEDIDSLKRQFGELKGQLGSMGTRLDSMEGKLTALQTPAPAPVLQSSLKSSGVSGHPSEGIGGSPDKIPAAGDPEPGFVNDDAVQEFRKAMLLFEAGRYADSSHGFSAFLERYPDHPFAGAAQFYVGKSYLKQNQYTQAYDEFQRVLTTYDRSSHVAETLRDLAETEEKLHKNQDAARHRHLLSSLFPQSPAFATVAVRPKHESAPIPPIEPSSNDSLSGESILHDSPAKKQVEEIAGEQAPSHRKTETSIRPPSGPSAIQLDEPPPPTAPVEKVPTAPKPKPAPKPGDVYPATEDKS